jgi:gluconolactonase
VTTDVGILVGGLGCPEGPDLLPDGTVVFVETFRCRVSAWDRVAGLRSFADVGGAPTACVVGSDGVYVAQNGLTAGPWRSPSPTPPSIQRASGDGRVEIVVESAGGKPLVGPNDLCFGRDGRLYFTDPGVFDPERPDEGTICVVDPDGTASVLEEVGPTFPNGIVTEPDGSVVWDESYTRRVRRRRADGTVQTIATLPESRVPDGMKLAEDGRLFIAGVTSGGIDVLAPDGKAVSFIEAGDGPLNCVFDGQDLIVTDFGVWSREAELAEEMTGRLLRVPVGVRGMPLHRGTVG